MKRHILTDGRGVPIAACITGANVHDKWLVGEVLDHVIVRAPRGPRRPTHLCLDKGYDYADAEAAVRQRGIRPHIRRRAEPPLIGCVRGKPRRWVVERTNAWHNRFRGRLIRWERKATITWPSSISPADSSRGSRRDRFRIGSKLTSPCLGPSSMEGLARRLERPESLQMSQVFLSPPRAGQDVYARAARGQSEHCTRPCRPTCVGALP